VDGVALEALAVGDSVEAGCAVGVDCCDDDPDSDGDAG